jgi:hypothetical protein
MMRFTIGHRRVGHAMNYFKLTKLTMLDIQLAKTDTGIFYVSISLISVFKARAD